MTMKKIMFNDKYGLTEAVLRGKKTQTRRVINVPDGCEIKVLDMPDGDKVSVLVNPSNGKHGTIDGVPVFGFVKVLEPKYFIGEVVAVAQSYKGACINAEDYLLRWTNGNDGYLKVNKSAGWNNKMFVKAELMPHHIRITNIRVERLQDISDEDCLAEGIYEVKGGFDETNYAYKGIGNSMFGTARCAYMSLIDKVCERYVWNQNPYVFVYEFEKVD